MGYNNNSQPALNPPNEPDRKSFILKTKIEDMLAYGYKAGRQFSWRDRELAHEIKDLMFKMYDYVIDIEKSYYKKSTLQDLDKANTKLRHFIRFSSSQDNFDEKVPKRDKKTGQKVLNDKGNVVMVSVSPPLDKKKYEVWSEMLDEIGRLIGGYLNRLKESEGK